jgi:hypothetical protein
MNGKPERWRKIDKKSERERYSEKVMHGYAIYRQLVERLQTSEKHLILSISPDFSSGCMNKHTKR